MIRRPPRSTLFPTRRSSDLEPTPAPTPAPAPTPPPAPVGPPDRKSTRLNSSHLGISYAVFCLKKKKKKTKNTASDPRGEEQQKARHEQTHSKPRKQHTQTKH